MSYTDSWRKIIKGHDVTFTPLHENNEVQFRVDIDGIPVLMRQDKETLDFKILNTGQQQKSTLNLEDVLSREIEAHHL